MPNSRREDALIIELRGSGMKWKDVSKRPPGRSTIKLPPSLPNYLERRSEWDDERKNKLARLYERFKPEMWARWQRSSQCPGEQPRPYTGSSESTHYQPPDTVTRHLTPPSPRSMYSRYQPLSAMPIGQPIRGEAIAAQASIPRPGMLPSMVLDHGDVY
ncbi:myb-like DNA-binding domain-containing protein [Hirsutella rhossiliensis]